MSRTRCAPKGDPRFGVAYQRVSTDEQRLGPEAQRAAIEAWAHREGVSIIAWHLDRGVSGGSELADRPALAAALGEVRARRAGVLVIAKRDRLARDVYIAATVERAVSRCGARVVCADGTANGDTPADEFMRRILDAAAGYERGLIRARTKAALAAKRARGERIGGIPYGWRLGPDQRVLEREPCEQAVIARIKALRETGTPLRTIARTLNAEHAPARAGRWHLTSLARVVKREAM